MLQLRRGFYTLLLILYATISYAAERNIVFFITDDQSPTLGCYGDPVAVTPNIDALAKDGILFRNAFATTASCSPSRSVVMSGLFSHTNGQYGLAHSFHHFESFPNVISLSLPHTLSNAGYRTAIVGKHHVSPEDAYHFETKINANGRNAVMMANNSKEFITAKDERPFLLYFAPSDPHRGGEVDETSPSEVKPNLFGNKPNRESFPKVEEVFYSPDKVPVPHFLPDTKECREELAQYYQSVSRIDQGLGRLIEILKEANLYDKTLIVFTSDHGIAMQGAKTTVYDAGLNVPFVVRNPYESKRGLVSKAMISHVDITPSLLDFAGELDHKLNRPKHWVNPETYWKEKGLRQNDNRSGSQKFTAYHGRSWLPLLGASDQAHHQTIFASHTFHEVTMYYPMRVVRDQKYKLIWNLASSLQVPSASDLWASSTWLTQYQLGPHAPYGQRTVGTYLKRPQFELYDIEHDPEESVNLAADPHFAPVLEEYREKLVTFQRETNDPWILKWTRE